MSRLLVIDCPVNPRTLHQDARDDLDVIGPAENFRWCLITTTADGAQPQIEVEGTGGLSQIPFADEALVVMPTVDIRLVRTKVPHISGKKLEALLPTLVEPYLLDQRTALHYQLLPPIPGATGADRTIAIISAAWLDWLREQLAVVPARTLVLIPDSLLLTLPADPTQPAEFLVDQQGALSVISTREGVDWGSGWVETGSDLASLASMYPQAQVHPIRMPWLATRARAWLSSKSPINLMPRQPVKKSGKAVKQKNSARWRPKVEWAHWRRPLQLGAVLAGVYLIGSFLNLGMLIISNWRWQNTLAETVRPYLATPTADNQAALDSFIHQASNKAHAQGKETPADFLPMAGKLQILLNSYPAGLLESVQYQANGLAFTLRPGKDAPSASVLAKRARELEIALIETGKNAYRMLPLAGLTPTGAQR